MSWQTVVPEPNALGESPFWHPHEQRLYWVDIPAQQVLRCDPATGALDCWDVPQEPGCIAPARSGGLVVALRDGVYRARDWGGELVRIARFDYDPATERFNDGKCDALGRFWAGTLYEPKDADRAALYSVDARGGGPVRAKRQAGGALTANGLAWSPDGRTLYWSDTGHHVIRAWDFDAHADGDAVLSRERVFQQFDGKPPGWQPAAAALARRAAGVAGSGHENGSANAAGYGGRPDGAAVDVEGNYYAAMFEGARIAKFSPAGQWLADIAVPAMCPTMPCFGGADRRTLYVTTASHKRPPEELEAWPLSGCVLAMRVEVPGLPVNFFDDGAVGATA